MKSFNEQGLEIFYIHNNYFSMMPQIVNDFHIDFKPFNLRTWFAEQVSLPSMRQMSCPLKTL